MQIRSPARCVLAVASGKGGVGKSTVALNMATVLAQQGAQVGLLDCDIYGPDIAAMTGLTRRVPVKQWTLARPGGPASTPVRPVERFGVHIVSAGLLFGEEQHLSWPAELIGVLLNQLLWSSTWPDLDYLLIDMPPGTADVTQSVFQLLPTAKVIIVVTPQEVAHLDARKLLSLLRSYRTEVLGGVENMAGVLCPCCGTTTDVFTPVAESRSIWSAGVEQLGKVPLDPPPAGLDAGVPVVVSRPDSAHAAALRTVVQMVQSRLGDE